MKYPDIPYEHYVIVGEFDRDGCVVYAEPTQEDRGKPRITIDYQDYGEPVYNFLKRAQATLRLACEHYPASHAGPLHGNRRWRECVS